MSREWTKETWYAEGPLTDEEACRAGGTPPNIVVASEEPGFPVHVAEFENEADRDRAVDCTNACAPLSDPTTSIPALLRVAEAARMAECGCSRDNPRCTDDGHEPNCWYPQLEKALSALPASDERGGA